MVTRSAGLKKFGSAFALNLICVGKIPERRMAMQVHIQGWLQLARSDSPTLTIFMGFIGALVLALGLSFDLGVQRSAGTRGDQIRARRECGESFNS